MDNSNIVCTAELSLYLFVPHKIFIKMKNISNKSEQK